MSIRIPMFPFEGRQEAALERLRSHEIFRCNAPDLAGDPVCVATISPTRTVGMRVRRDGAGIDRHDDPAQVIVTVDDYRAFSWIVCQMASVTA